MGLRDQLAIAKQALDYIEQGTPYPREMARLALIQLRGVRSAGALLGSRTSAAKAAAARANGAKGGRPKKHN